MVYTWVAYVAGAVLGLAADRGGPRIRRDWPIYLRAQLLVSSVVLGLAAAWRLNKPTDALPLLAMAGVGLVILGTSLATRGAHSPGLAALESWSANPNSTFWVLPVAGALVGPTATAVAAVTNSLYALPGALQIHLLRRDAPRPQRAATSLIDQSALGALALGLLLHLAGPAPEWTRWFLLIGAPLVAFVGAALFTGSVLHPHNVEIGRTAAGVKRWLFLSTVRIACLVPIAIFAGSKAVAVVAILAALGAPAFNPVQLAVLYQYRTATVNAAARWGWLFLPIGLAIAVAIS